MITAQAICASPGMIYAAIVYDGEIVDEAGDPSMRHVALAAIDICRVARADVRVRTGSIVVQTVAKGGRFAVAIGEPVANASRDSHRRLRRLLGLR